VPDKSPHPRAGRRQWAGLAVLALPTLLVSIDVFVMLLALPRLSADLGADGTQQLWIMDIYGFMVSGFLITMGNLGDRIGRRRLLMVGAAVFGLASLAAAFATSPGMLIAARALLGVAGATLAPSTLALISTMFRDPRQRSLAIGVWLVCFMGGATIGPVVGGAMLANFWWGSVFLLGVPAMALLLVLGPVVLPEDRNPDAGPPDLVSVALSLAAILPMIYGLKEVARNGWQPLPAAALAAGAALGVVFARRQRELTHPLLDLRLFADRAFSAALGAMLLNTVLGGAVMLLVAQHLQLVAGLSPLRAGLWLLPAVAASTLAFLVSPLLARRIRPAYVICSGLAVCVTGLLVIASTDAAAGLAAVVAGFALMNLGTGPLVTLGTDLVVGSAPPEKAGSAAGMNETCGEFGFALGIAVLGSVGTAIYRDRVADNLPAGIPPAAARAARDTLTGATHAAQGLPEQVAAALLAAAREAFTGQVRATAVLAAAGFASVAVLIAALLRHVPASRQAQPPDASPTASTPDPATVAPSG
jgi:DHA2 family multidrug resistance protein-like MFS transporter